MSPAQVGQDKVTQTGEDGGLAEDAGQHPANLGLEAQQVCLGCKSIVGCAHLRFQHLEHGMSLRRRQLGIFKDLQGGSFHAPIMATVRSARGVVPFTV